MDDKTKPLTGVHLQIATPCGSNRYHRHYVHSLQHTIEVLTHYGAVVNWLDFPGCSDLAFARCRIFGNFQRSHYTHLMMIDDDMGWEAKDIVRLLLSKKDFIGAVGCKKEYPLAFCVDNRDEADRLMPLEHEDETGTTHVTAVGMAFMLINKDVTEKMVAAYPELAFYHDGYKEHALFDPMILPRENGQPRRFGEDFAFCQRWKKIGGKVWIIPDIRLKHSGDHTFEGMWLDSFRQKEAQNLGGFLKSLNGKNHGRQETESPSA